jgi:hypothetical protein
MRRTASSGSARSPAWTPDGKVDGARGSLSPKSLQFAVGGVDVSGARDRGYVVIDRAASFVLNLEHVRKLAHWTFHARQRRVHVRLLEHALMLVLPEGAKELSGSHEGVGGYLSFAAPQARGSRGVDPEVRGVAHRARASGLRSPSPPFSFDSPSSARREDTPTLAAPATIPATNGRRR